MWSGPSTPLPAGCRRAGSTHCLMSYVGLEATELYGVHLLDLETWICQGNFPVALVAGLNCFLPTILADFAKYAVCYRLKEDALGGKLICKHLPFEKEKGFATVLISFMLVFATALLVWLRLSRSSSDEETVPCYKAFLTKKYVKVCRYFEAERLKTMIVGLGATVSIVCCGIMMKIGLEVWRERRSKAAPD
eukprot:g32029.t1